MKNIFITGVCGGMGKATALYLLEKGYNIIGIDNKEFCDVGGITYYKVDITSKISSLNWKAMPTFVANFSRFFTILSSGLSVEA